MDNTMQVTSKTSYQLRLQNFVFTLLLITIIGLLAWLSTHYSWQADWTHNHRHTLSTASEQLLAELQAPLTITVYASTENDTRIPIKELIQRYQRKKPDISLRFVDPITAVGEARERGIQIDGELILDYQGRTEHVRTAPHELSEQDITWALERLVRTEHHLITFLEGHGERSPNRPNNQDISQFAQELRKRGLDVQTLNFGKKPYIPSDTRVLVIASSQNNLLPVEVNAISEYIDNGGNLLWLIDSHDVFGLEAVAAKLGLTIQPGHLVDPIGRFLGVDNPETVVITGDGYTQHAVTTDIDQNLTLFPQAYGLIVKAANVEEHEHAASDWAEMALLSTNSQVWSETGKLEGAVEYNESVDISGPIDIAFALTRPKPIASEPHELNEAMAEPATVSESMAITTVNAPVAETDDNSAKQATATENEANDATHATLEEDIESYEATDDTDDSVEEDDEEATATDDVEMNAALEGEDSETDDDEPNAEAEIDQDADDEKSTSSAEESAEPVITPEHEQRIIVIGDGDFLSNAFFQFGGNFALGLNIMNWLAAEDNLIDIPSKTDLDLSLDFSSNTLIFIGIIFLILLPLTLISISIAIWLHRRKA
jgi:ABC-type uncharacterized transport system involved in gliding motility auxiliary subunit